MCEREDSDFRSCTGKPDFGFITVSIRVVIDPTIHFKGEIALCNSFGKLVLQLTCDLVEK